MMWIENDDLNWSGATILNMEPVKQEIGKRGGLAVIIAPKSNTPSYIEQPLEKTLKWQKSSHFPRSTST